MTHIIITFSHAKFAALKPASNGEEGVKNFFCPAVIKPIKQKLIEHRFVPYFSFSDQK